jgi:predicted nucleic acid-binding protein
MGDTAQSHQFDPRRRVAGSESRERGQQLFTGFFHLPPDKFQPVAVRSLWQPALTRALDSSVAVDDALFVELAVQRELKLATFDAELLRKFPEIAQRPRSFASN